LRDAGLRIFSLALVASIAFRIRPLLQAEMRQEARRKGAYLPAIGSIYQHPEGKLHLPGAS
jgi:hypothetical protein